MHVMYIDDVHFYRGNRQVPDLLSTSTVLVGGGLHLDRLDMAGMQRVFNRSEFVNVSRRVCMTVPAPGRNKPKNYLQRQGSGPTEVYNQLIRDFACLGSQDFVFEAFEVTRNATSIDGTHYYQEPNILLAQLVLNALDTSHGQLLSVSLSENGKPSV